MMPAPTLLAAVAADPKDDAPRLALADWYREHGSPRGAFIRAQLALTGHLNPADRLALRRKAESLLTEHWEEWMAPLKKLGATGEFHRGFVEELALSEKDLARNGEALFAREPVTRLRLEVKDGKGLAQAVMQPWFSQVRWLKLMGAVDAAAVLASAPYAGHLETLLLSGEGTEGLSELVTHGAFPALRALSLTGMSLDARSIEPFAETRLSLTRLYLSQTGLLDEQISVLAEARPLRTLEWLALNRNEELLDEGAEALASSKVLVNLQRLELAGTGVSAEGALAFRRAKALPALRHLDLSQLYLDPDEVEPLRKRLGKGLKL